MIPETQRRLNPREAAARERREAWIWFLGIGLFLAAPLIHHGGF